MIRLLSLSSDYFVLNTGNGGHSYYASLSDLLLHCSPIVTLYPGVDKWTALAAVAAPPHQATNTEGLVAQAGQVHTPSGRFQAFPNNASGGGVGLGSPPPPGMHGAAASQPQHQPSPAHHAAASSALGGFVPPISPVAASPSSSTHPFSFNGLAAALPRAAPVVAPSTNPLGEGIVQSAHGHAMPPSYTPEGVVWNAQQPPAAGEH